MSACSNLGGLGVLVTRPAHQAQGLCRLIAAYGGRPVLFPVLTIEATIDPAPARALLTEDWDLVVYTSVNAVQFAARLRAPPVSAGILSGGRAQVAAIGMATAQALTALECIPDLVPERHDSEGLLTLPAFTQPAGQRILIVRGEGGRALLADTLRKRGAQVAVAEVYRRGLPAVDVEPLLDHWDRDVQVVTVTSGEILDNLLCLLGDVGRSRLCATPLVVISDRVRQLAIGLGIDQVVCATGASDAALLAALGTLIEERPGQT